MRSSTCRLSREACRQVPTRTPARGDSAYSVVPDVTLFKGQAGRRHLHGMRIFVGVTWIRPRQSGSSSWQTLRNKTARSELASRTYVLLRPQMRCQLGSVPPGPADRLGEAAATNGQRGIWPSVLPWARRLLGESAQARPSHRPGTTSRHALERQGALASRRYEAADELVGNHTLIALLTAA